MNGMNVYVYACICVCVCVCVCVCACECVCVCVCRLVGNFGLVVINFGYNDVGQPPIVG
jgi:hypothetical protein